MVRPVWWSDRMYVVEPELRTFYGLGLKSHLCYTNFFQILLLHPPSLSRAHHTNGVACVHNLNHLLYQDQTTGSDEQMIKWNVHAASFNNNSILGMECVLVILRVVLPQQIILFSLIYQRSRSQNHCLAKSYQSGHIKRNVRCFV